MKFPNVLLRAKSAKIFLFVNLIFGMYACSILVTAVRLTWDPSTYIWFRSLMNVQYNVTTGYLYCVGFFLTALAFLGINSVHPSAKLRLLAHFFGTVILMISEIVYAIYMGVTLINWWKYADQAALLRKGLVLHDYLKTGLYYMEKYFNVGVNINKAIHEVEQDAPKNVYVVVATLLMSVVLQLTALVVSWKLQSNISTYAKVNIKNYSVVPAIVRSKVKDYPEEV